MRLTKYDDENRYYEPCDYESDKQSTILKLCKKLGQLEDIEDEIGIDLIIREKALQQGAWYKSNNKGLIFCPFVKVVGKGKSLELKQSFRSPVLCVKTKDYGITWALTKEVLL